MDYPTYRRTLDGIRDEVFPRFYRLTDESTGAILIEFGKGHIDKGMDLSAFPSGSIGLNRGTCKNSPTPLVVKATSQNAELIKAIRAMRPADISHMQQHDNGCGAAVIAHLTGATYKDTIRRLYPAGKPRVTGTQRLAAETDTRRIFCEARNWAEAERAGAVAVLIKAPATGPRQYGHYVAIDPGMVVVDPELVLRYPLAEYPRRDWVPMAYFVRS